MDELSFERSVNVANNSVSTGTQLFSACQQLLGLQSHKLRAATEINKLIFANRIRDNGRRKELLRMSAVEYEQINPKVT